MKNKLHPLDYYNSVIELLDEKIQIYYDSVTYNKENNLFLTNKNELKFINEKIKSLFNEGIKEQNINNVQYQMWNSKEIYHAHIQKRRCLKSLKKLYIKYESQKDLTIS